MKRIEELIDEYGLDPLEIPERFRFQDYYHVGISIKYAYYVREFRMYLRLLVKNPEIDFYKDTTENELLLRMSYTPDWIYFFIWPGTVEEFCGITSKKLNAIDATVIVFDYIKKLNSKTIDLLYNLK